MGDTTRPLPRSAAPPGEHPRRRPRRTRRTANPKNPENPKNPKNPASRRRRYLRRAAVTLAASVGVLVIVAATLWVITPPASEATSIARRLAAQHGIAYPGPNVPPDFARPLIATEDHRFYSEPGVDPFAVARVIKGKLTGAPDQGGATLEQQLAKMLYTPGSSGFAAEIEQATLAFKLNFTYSKQQILDLYAEVAYYGNGYYGLQQASCGYFGHPAADLTVGQGAMLAGVVNAPSLDDPATNPGNARARLEHVIARMEAVGYLTAAKGEQALNTPLGLVATGGAGNSAAAAGSPGC